MKDSRALSPLLGHLRLGGFASACFLGSRRRACGLPGVRRSGLGEADAGLITVGEPHTPSIVLVTLDLIGKDSQCNGNGI